MFDNTLFFQSSLSGLGERYKKEYSTSGTSMAAIKVNIQKFPCFLLNNGWMCVCVCVCVCVCFRVKKIVEFSGLEGREKPPN